MEERGEFTDLQVLGLVVNGQSGTSVIKECQNEHFFLSSLATPQFLIGLFFLEGTAQMTEPLEYLCADGLFFLGEAGPTELCN